MKALSLLIKPASGNCNLRCKYCFYSDVTASREEENRGMMSVQTLELIVQKALMETTKMCAFCFQGGEPTLSGLPFFANLIKFQKKYNKNNAEIRNTIQTNGVLIDENWADFFAKNSFLVGLSVDGKKSTHDYWRVNFDGRGSHDAAMNAAEILTKRGVEFNILSVLTRQLAAHPDKLYRFYKNNNLRYIQIIPCMDGLNKTHGSNCYSLDAKTHGEFLCRLFDLWYADFVRGEYYSIRSFDNYIQMIMGNPPENCAMSGSCKSHPVIEADGTVYPCDFYVLDQHQIGNIHKDSFAFMLESDAAKKFEQSSSNIHSNCKKCKYYAICRGGCRRDKDISAEGNLNSNHYCESYKMFFAHTMPRMLQIARRLMNNN